MNYRDDISCECGHLDHAVTAGSPWSHVRFHYGQLLGVEDFNQEQMAFIHGKQIRNALLHGSGTVWGLKVKDHEDLSEVLAVEPGLALDALGREIYLPEEFCLDVSGIHKSDLWGKLETVSLRPFIKRAFVVVRFSQCLSQRVPAIRPPCSPEDQTAEYARVNDSFHISLDITAPPDPQRFQKQWMSQSDPSHQPGWSTPRDRLVDVIINNSPAAISDFWQTLNDAPLLLAEVQFELRQNGTIAITGLNNRVRPLLPSVQLAAEQFMGQRLLGKDERQPLKVIAVNVTAARPSPKKMAIHIDSNLQFAPETVTTSSVKLNVLAANNPWLPVNFDGNPIFDNQRVTINLDWNGAWPDGIIYQLFLNGRGTQPIVSKTGSPLMGWWDEPVNMLGRGRNVSIVRQWNPDQL
ncbi:hypothetical protein D3OALGA1CA_4392 [Olavius algarvensis associated proteobacterium Delta 3]|nr:hypothetical protein D3OALGA1CA_4392 [Olavius algarvensis associated proteobacterium Delta 3]